MFVACLFLKGFALSGRGSRGKAAQMLECVVWNRRLAPVPHHTLKQANAAGVSKRAGWKTDRLFIKGGRQR